MAEPYESDTTRFIRELLKKNPRLAEEQRKARATWWDKKLDPQELKRYAQAQVPQPAYVYYSLPAATLAAQAGLPKKQRGNPPKANPEA